MHHSQAFLIFYVKKCTTLLPNAHFGQSWLCWAGYFPKVSISLESGAFFNIKYQTRLRVVHFFKKGVPQVSIWLESGAIFNIQYQKRLRGVLLLKKKTHHSLSKCFFLKSSFSKTMILARTFALFG